MTTARFNQSIIDNINFQTKYAYLYPMKLDYLGNVYEVISLSQSLIWLQDVNGLTLVQLTGKQFDKLVLNGEIAEANL